MDTKKQKQSAKEFKDFWQTKGYEKGQTQQFWSMLLRDVFQVQHLEDFIEFEKQVKIKSTNFIDAYIPTTKVLIEQKSHEVDLNKSSKQSNNEELTAYQQAKRYADEMPYSLRPRWIITCNFLEFHIHDMETPKAEPTIIKLSNFENDYQKLSFIADTKTKEIRKEEEISIKAGEIVGKIYDNLLTKYLNPESKQTLHSLNVLCVRLVFLLYAEDSNIFPKKNQFYNYMVWVPASEWRSRLIELFKTLDTPKEKRDPYIDETLNAFPYVNGGLFSDTEIEIPRFDEKLKQIILKDASSDFSWNDISPTIFGAVFESTLNQETRRKGGMHYTSIENIHKVIDALFLNDLTRELDDILLIPNDKQKKRKIEAYTDKLAKLKFFDPACGSGNFLTETYLSLRRLENKALKEYFHNQTMLGDIYNPIKVSINQFYGIEINDFAVTVATTALWISEAQMMQETEEFIKHDLDFLPLKSYTNITEGNALQLDWQQVVSPQELNYIIGNPPFTGARLMSKEQKQDLLDVFSNKWKNLGNMDYVCGWYKKAVDMIQTTQIKAALVSTNSITQGEQVANLFCPLVEKQNMEILFAYRTFRWDSEATEKAHVHCVIIGFHCSKTKQEKIIFDGDKKITASHINPYLLDADDVFIYSRSKPLCNVPPIGIGNQPIDNGNYLFSKEEMLYFIKKEPKSEKYFIKWYGAEEFIHNKPRYCLWLGDCSPKELHDMPLCLERVKNVREYRLQSSRKSTLKLADTPTRFQVENFPKGNYIIVPEISSEWRTYITMGFMDDTSICSNLVKLIPNATLYHFGVLESIVHMAWMRVVCGRLGNSYRYSKNIVYNNFPWPKVDEKQKKEIETTAQKILDARAMYPDSSLADLYDDTTMPINLRKAHKENDKAVLKAYGWDYKTISESEIVAKLFAMYEQLISKE